MTLPSLAWSRPAEETGVEGMIHEYAEPFFHIGLICRDVERLAAEFSEKLGIVFHEPKTFEMPSVDDGRRRSVRVRACFSEIGPPYIELLAGDGQGLYHLEHDVEFHHVGLWVPSCADALSRAEEQGMSANAVVSDSDRQLLLWFTNPRQTGGLRFEMIGDADRENFTTFLRTGTYPGFVL
jgi:hypothetical protein